MLVVLSAVLMLVDLFVAVMKVTVSVAIIQLEVSVTLMQVKARNVWALTNYEFKLSVNSSNHLFSSEMKHFGISLKKVEI